MSKTQDDGIKGEVCGVYDQTSLGAFLAFPYGEGGKSSDFRDDLTDEVKNKRLLNQSSFQTVSIYRPLSSFAREARKIQSAYARRAPFVAYATFLPFGGKIAPCGKVYNAENAYRSIITTFSLPQ